MTCGALKPGSAIFCAHRMDDLCECTSPEQRIVLPSYGRGSPGALLVISALLSQVHQRDGFASRGTAWLRVSASLNEFDAGFQALPPAVNAYGVRWEDGGLSMPDD
jgi:hypothetical protein